MSERPYQPFYKPYGMTDEEYEYEKRIAAEKLAEWEWEQEQNESNLLDAQVIICPDCLGTGKEICDSPDHGFRDAVGGVRLDGHANGCPCCGNDELHRIPNTTCNRCNGTGKL